jgi:hypothetical protein
VYRDYAPQNVQFYFIYKSLAHPELEGDYVQPFTLEERLAHARQATTQLGASIPWLVDSMDNRLKHALGDRPNSELVIDPEGKVVRKRAWSDPAALRRDLEELVGPVPQITLPEELNLKTLPPIAAAAPRGVLKRVTRHGMFALVAEPIIERGGSPFFVKLRAEAEIPLIDKGRGKLYLGFHLDPLHGAHWNNLYEPLRFELDVPKGTKLSAGSGQAPRIKATSDCDPREFLMDVEAWPADAKVPLTVTYSVCTGQTCHVVKQEYVLRRRLDKDGGAAADSGLHGMTTEAVLKWLLRGDENGDGRLARSELNSFMRERLVYNDQNADGMLDAGEIEKMAAALTRR